MNNLHIAEVGALFQNEDSFTFLSNQNMLEYDFIIIDTESFKEEVYGKPLPRTQKRVAELKEFIKQKNIPVVFMFSGDSRFASHGIEHTIPEILDIDVIEDSVTGRKIELNGESLFADFLKKFSSNLEYTTGFSKHPGISIGYAKSKPLSVGFYTKDFVFIPTFHEDQNIDDDDFLQGLYSICQSVRRNDDQIILPEWTNKYYLPGEGDERKKLMEIENSIKNLEIERMLCQQQLSNYIPLKQLWTATGLTLETAIKKVFEELGFKLLQSSTGRDDITMEWNGKILVVEIKGQTKSGSERNAAQLEKWVSTYFENHGIHPKGLLIVNTYREMPLENRDRISFPDQMIPYSKARKHCLLTSLQLCGLLLAARKQNGDKENLIKELLETEGVFEHFQDWRNFLVVDKKSKKNTPKVTTSQ